MQLYITRKWHKIFSYPLFNKQFICNIPSNSFNIYLNNYCNRIEYSKTRAVGVYFVYENKLNHRNNTLVCGSQRLLHSAVIVPENISLSATLTRRNKNNTDNMMTVSALLTHTTNICGLRKTAIICVQKYEYLYIGVAILRLASHMRLFEGLFVALNEFSLFIFVLLYKKKLLSFHMCFKMYFKLPTRNMKD